MIRLVMGIATDTWLQGAGEEASPSRTSGCVSVSGTDGANEHGLYIPGHITSPFGPRRHDKLGRIILWS